MPRTTGSVSSGARRRLAAYVALLLAVACVWAFRSARAEMAQLSLQLGRDLLPLSDLLTERARVDINGERIWVASALSPQPIREILDRFESYCRGEGVSGHTWGSGASATDKLSVSKLVDVGVLRSEDGAEGAVFCLPGGAEKRDPFPRRLGEFLRTKDLGQLGRVRYAYIRRERGMSQVLTLWSDEHLRLDKMVGMADEEPGFDNPDLPRPIRSRRIVSATIDGTPYGARGYVSQADPKDVLAAYSDAMVSRGFRAATTADPLTLGFLRDGSLVTIRADRRAEGTVIGVAEMGVDPRVSAPESGSSTVSIQ